MIIRNVCGVLETFIELALSVGMFVEICGKEKLRGRLARTAAVVVLGVYLSVALPTNIILLQCLPNPDKPEKILQFLHISSTIKKNVGGCVHVTYR